MDSHLTDPNVVRPTPIHEGIGLRPRLSGVPKQSRRDSLPHHRKDWNTKKSRISVYAVNGMDELMKVYAVRSAVYIGEYNFSYDNTFDGNDLCGTHILATVDGEPAGSMRVRWFGEFAKPERLAVLPNFRLRRYGARGVAHALGKYAFDLCAQKGYKKVIGFAREELVRFWASFGEFNPIEGKEFDWNGSHTIPMIGELAPPVDAISLKTDPLVILRREGEWYEDESYHGVAAAE